MWYLLGITLVGAGVLTLLRVLRGSSEDARKRAEQAIETGNPLVPSARVQRALVASEVLLWEGHRHPISLWKWWTAAILLQPVTIFVALNASSGVAFLVWLAGTGICAFRVWLWRRDKLCVTDRRIIEVSGLLSYRIDIMPLAKLTDARLRTPTGSRLLCWTRVVGVPFGTVIVESAGQDQALSTIDFVPAAEHVYKVIMSKVSSIP